MMYVLRGQILKGIKGYRTVNTWSSLATAFNTTSKSEYEFGAGRKETGLFCIPELKTTDGFKALNSRVSSQTDEFIAEAIGSKRKRKMVEIFDELSDTLCKVADLAEFVRFAHPDEQFAKAAEDTCIFLNGIVEKLNTHRELYNALLHVVNNGDILETSNLDNHVAKLFLFDFEQSGIHLPESQREEVVQLNNYILEIGQAFMAGAVNARTMNAGSLSDEIKQHFAMENNEIIVHGAYADSANIKIREAAYKLFLCPDARQEYLLQELLNARHQLAKLCGFPSYAHRAVKGSTVETPAVIHEFLNILNDDLQIKATEDYREMQIMKNAESPVKQEIMPWDTAYFTSKAKQLWLNTSSAEFAPYFSLGACMDGINIITQSLYGIRLESVPVLSGEVWLDNIQKLAVVDESEGVLGHIYCDLFERPGKPSQDCHFTIRGGKRLPDGSYQNPIAVVMLSLSAPKWSNPCLLSPASLSNLFHEMGHALHSMLGRTQYQHVTGTRCCTDFAEVPSVLMEHFANDPRVVSMFAKHFQTQEQIPQHLLDKLRVFKNIFCASELQIQVFYSMMDQVYHSNKLEKSSTDVLRDIQDKYYGLPYVPHTALQLRFSHLVGYGAKYYSYLISRAVASWIWQSYFEADPFSRSAGDRYRRECLAHGGGKPASKLVSDFLNKEASPTNFAKSLLTEIDIRNEQIQNIKR